jgi:hypothetical protein
LLSGELGQEAVDVASAAGDGKDELRRGAIERLDGFGEGVVGRVAVAEIGRDVGDPL